MTGYLRHPVTAVWALLIAATVVSWLLGTRHDVFVASARVATVGVLVIAFVKVGLVGRHFMELRAAPRPLVLLFNAWVVAVCAAILGIYLG